MPDRIEAVKAAERALQAHSEYPAADRVRHARQRYVRALAGLLDAARFADEVLDRRGATVSADSVRGRLLATISQHEGS